MRQPGKLATIGVTAGMAFSSLAGCGGSGSSPEHSGSRPAPQPELGPVPGAPFQGVLRCVAETPDKWEPTPSNLSADTIGEALGVSPDAVEAGEWGPANCDPAIEASQVGSRANVRGIGSKCLVIGLGGKPEAGKTYHDVLAVCAGPAGTQA